MDEKISVIIATTCESSRRSCILNAIESVQSQQGVVVNLIIVVNGDRFDTDLLQHLKSRRDLLVAQLEVGCYPAAQRYGRSLVETDFFAFLDDDDIFLPNALTIRMKPMLNDPSLDLVATNGIWDIQGGRARVSNPEMVNENPLAALLQENWLASCGGLYRTRTISLDYFDGITKYFEWTLLAFRILLSGKKILFLDLPTYQINDTGASLSKSTAYMEALPGFLNTITQYELKPEIIHALNIKIAGAWHSLSEHYRTLRNYKGAWYCHLRSLIMRGGLQYLFYTRYLLLDLLKNRDN